MATVGIGPQFFRKSLNDYSNWLWALPREAMQNSMDAPHSKNIHVWIEPKDGNTLFSWGNDGAPMEREELEGKLLTLGESGKEFKGTVGGFGAAKLILLFAHLEYEIITGNWYVRGSGGNYTIEERPYYAGTHTKVLVQGNHFADLLGNIRGFMFQAQWSGSVKINGEEWTQNLRKGSRRRDFDWATIYTNKSIHNRLVVRTNGIPMFYRHINCDGRCVVVELKAGGADVLQSNRDSLKSNYQQQLDAFIDEITVNKVSAFRDDAPVYTLYVGDKIHSTPIAEETLEHIISAAYATIPEHTDDEPIGNVIVDTEVVYAQAPRSTFSQPMKRSKINYEFIIKNDTGMMIPTHYLPSEFSEYSDKLVKIWAKVLLTMHDLFNKQGEFSIGFVFDEMAAAEFEFTPKYGDVYYINPVAIKKQKGTNSRSMAKRYKFNAAGRWAIVADALHEFVHGAIGLEGHDELYSTMLTELTGVVLREKQRFNCCFV